MKNVLLATTAAVAVLLVAVAAGTAGYFIGHADRGHQQMPVTGTNGLMFGGSR